MDIPTIQLTAYIALTVASVIVAVTSATMGYLQNFGWEPHLYVTGIGVNSMGDDRNDNAIVTFEVWNRRKYPIAIVTGAIDFLKVKVIDSGERDGWQQWRNTMTYYGDKIKLEPMSFKEFQITADLDGASALPDRWPVTIKYFDPVKGKELEMQAFVQYRK
jgi:hypothetical protein